ncbi:hypothetical protein [Solirubrobacter soli]|uniref:hypothetical protein n=1 Tax=Solirubrobacter soli TaxID=363832 RepID=UPI00040C998B|nr:hypothetical protein [Solirubrobacter soli]
MTLLRRAAWIAAALVLIAPATAGAQDVPPETTITDGPDDDAQVRADPTFTFESDTPDATFVCARTDSPGTLLEHRRVFDCDSPTQLNLTDPGTYRFSVSAVAPDGTADPTPEERTFTLLPPPPSNRIRPQIVPDAGNPHTYRCEPGSWDGQDRPFRYVWQRVTRDTSMLGGYRVETVATTQTYRAAASSALQLQTLSWRFQCIAEAANQGGSTQATSDRATLDPVLEQPLQGRPYGNVRIRGIDVFQVVQPNAGAQMYGIQPRGPFTAFPGGGTPTDWRLFPVRGGLNVPKPIDTDPQRVAYDGVTLDRHKPTTAVVYVDMQNAPANDPGQRLAVTLKVREGAFQYREETKIVTDPPVSTTPYVTAAERGDLRFGVQFDISVLHGVTEGGTFDVDATVGFDPSAKAWNARECDTGDCAADDRFKLTGVRVDDGYANSELMIRAVDLFVDGDAAQPSAFDVLRARNLFPNAQGITLTDYGNARINVTDAANKTDCNGVPLRACREAAVQQLVDSYSTYNPARTFGPGVVYRNYDVIMGVQNWDPGFASGRDVTQLTTQGPVGPAPFMIVNSGMRPLTSAAHELGHILTAPHADTTCGGPAGGSYETWKDDLQGRLQGTRFTGLGNAPEVDTNARPLYDLMSYCADTLDTPANPGNAWISPFNWNRFSLAFTQLGERGLTRGARVFAQEGAAPKTLGMAYATGSVGAGHGDIGAVLAPDEDSVPPESVPSSPLRLRARDATGAVISDAGVRVTPTEEAPGAGSFGGPVPANAASVELVKDGEVLDTIERSRPPRVRITRHGWTASDPDSRALTATVDTSRDGRHWHTIYSGPNRDRIHLPGHGHVRVTVSDGFNAARAVS